MIGWTCSKWTVSNWLRLQLVLLDKYICPYYSKFHKFRRSQHNNQVEIWDFGDKVWLYKVTWQFVAKSLSDFFRCVGDFFKNRSSNVLNLFFEVIHGCKSNRKRRNHLTHSNLCHRLKHCYLRSSSYVILFIIFIYNHINRY